MLYGCFCNKLYFYKHIYSTTSIGPLITVGITVKGHSCPLHYNQQRISHDGTRHSWYLGSTFYNHLDSGI